MTEFGGAESSAAAGENPRGKVPAAARETPVAAVAMAQDSTPGRKTNFA